MTAKVGVAQFMMDERLLGRWFKGAETFRTLASSRHSLICSAFSSVVSSARWRFSAISAILASASVVEAGRMKAGMRSRSR